MMKLSLGVAAALAGFTAAQQPADVFMLRADQVDNSEPPSLGHSVAHLVLLQRLAPEAGVASLSNFPEDAVDATISYVNKFGSTPQPLFGDASSAEPSQLLIMLEGVTSDNANDLKQSLGEQKTAFQVADAPSSLANRNLVQTDLPSVGVRQTSCELERAINPLEEECWSGKSSVALYDARKNPSVASIVADNIPRLTQLAQSGEMETTILLLPESSRASSLNAWSPTPLRRRQRAEEVMLETDDPEAETEIEIEVVDPEIESDTSPNKQSSNSKNGPFVVSANANSIPACFDSQDSCLTATGNCSSHGECVEKYAKAGDASASDDSGACFVCRCLSTTSDTGSVTHWGGTTCGKVDISVSFWLFAGVTLLLVGILTFAVGLLYSIGDETLPGVIGAGVSKTK